jgi:hypothetical protein
VYLGASEVTATMELYRQAAAELTAPNGHAAI